MIHSLINIRRSFSRDFSFTSALHEKGIATYVSPGEVSAGWKEAEESQFTTLSLF